MIHYKFTLTCEIEIEFAVFIITLGSYLELRALRLKLESLIVSFALISALEQTTIESETVMVLI